MNIVLTFILACMFIDPPFPLGPTQTLSTEPLTRSHGETLCLAVGGSANHEGLYETSEIKHGNTVIGSSRYAEAERQCGISANEGKTLTNQSLVGFSNGLLLWNGGVPLLDVQWSKQLIHRDTRRLRSSVSRN
jgi:hypothetical protein